MMTSICTSERLRPMPNGVSWPRGFRCGALWVEESAVSAVTGENRWEILVVSAKTFSRKADVRAPMALRVCACMFLFLPFASRAADVPRIVLDRTDADLGDRFAGEEVPLKFTVKNEGIAPLLIKSVGAACGCLAAKPVWPEKVEAGGSGTILVPIDTRKFQGSVSKTFAILTNDPAKPKLIVRMRGRVQKVFGISPSEVAFGKVDPKAEPQSRTVTITNLTDNPLSLTMPEEAPAGPFTFRLETVEEGKKWAVHVTTKPPFQTGLNTVTAVLTTNHEKIKKVKVEFSAYLAPAVQVIPPKLVIPGGALPRAMTRILSLHVRRGEVWRITSARCSDDNVALNQKSGAAGARRIYATFGEGYALPKEAKVNIVLTCQQDGQEKPVTKELTVPIVPANSK